MDALPFGTVTVIDAPDPDTGIGLVIERVGDALGDLCDEAGPELDAEDIAVGALHVLMDFVATCADEEAYEQWRERLPRVVAHLLPAYRLLRKPERGEG